MCEAGPIPQAVQDYILSVANAELDECQAFFPTPKGNLGGKVVLVGDQVKLVGEFSEEVQEYLSRCKISIRMAIKTEITLPDGTVASIARLSRYPGDVEGMDAARRMENEKWRGI